MVTPQSNSMWNVLCREPYRIFFPLGILIGALGTSHWIWYWRGVIPAYSRFFHASIQMQSYMGCFIFGFLMTAMPRFSSTQPATSNEVLRILGLFILNVTFLFLSQWVAAEVCFILILFFFLRFVLVRVKHKNPKANPPVEFIWIPIALFQAFLGSVILILLQLGLAPNFLANIGEDMASQGFVLSIVAGVGGFLTPRLIGRFQTHKPDCNVCDEAEQIQKSKARDRRFHLVLGLLMIASFGFDSRELTIWGTLIRAVIATVVMWHTHVLPKPPRVPDLFAWLTWISMWMVLIGLWSTVFFPVYEKATLHFIFIGGFSLMTFAVGTMVVLSHAGEPHLLRKSIPELWIVVLSMGSALTLRVISIFFTNAFFELLAYAALAWMIGAVAWICLIVPKISQFQPDEDFEHQHEEMKRRVSP